MATVRVGKHAQGRRLLFFASCRYATHNNKLHVTTPMLMEQIIALSPQLLRGYGVQQPSWTGLDAYGFGMPLATAERRLIPNKAGKAPMDYVHSILHETCMNTSTLVRIHEKGKTYFPQFIWDGNAMRRRDGVIQRIAAANIMPYYISLTDMQMQLSSTASQKDLQDLAQHAVAASAASATASAAASAAQLVC